jgi:hypothetical protein
MLAKKSGQCARESPVCHKEKQSYQRTSSLAETGKDESVAHL